VNSAHQHNRMGGNEALLFSLSNGLRYYAASVEDKTTMEKDDGSNVNFLVLKKIIINYLTLKNKQVPKNLEVIIRIQDMGNASDHSHYYKIKT
jgi:hypothetical protein